MTSRMIFHVSNVLSLKTIMCHLNTKEEEITLVGTSPVEHMNGRTVKPNTLVTVDDPFPVRLGALVQRNTQQALTDPPRSVHHRPQAPLPAQRILRAVILGMIPAPALVKRQIKSSHSTSRVGHRECLLSVGVLL